MVCVCLLRFPDGTERVLPVATDDPWMASDTAVISALAGLARPLVLRRVYPGRVAGPGVARHAYEAEGGTRLTVLVVGPMAGGFADGPEAVHPSGPLPSR